MYFLVKKKKKTIFTQKKQQLDAWYQLPVPSLPVYFLRVWPWRESILGVQFNCIPTYGTLGFSTIYLYIAYLHYPPWYPASTKTPYLLVIAIVAIIVAIVMGIFVPCMICIVTIIVIIVSCNNQQIFVVASIIIPIFLDPNCTPAVSWLCERFSYASEGLQERKLHNEVSYWNKCVTMKFQISAGRRFEKSKNIAGSSWKNDMLHMVIALNNCKWDYSSCN